MQRLYHLNGELGCRSLHRGSHYNDMTDSQQVLEDLQLSVKSEKKKFVTINYMKERALGILYLPL